MVEVVGVKLHLKLLMIAFYSYPEKDKMLAKHKIIFHDMYDAMNCNPCLRYMDVMVKHVS